MIELKNVTKRYSLTMGKDAVSDVSFQLPRGQIVGLFGENGAGKTTLMKCVLNLLKYRGEITLDGVPITHRNIDKIAYATCEHSFFPSLTAAAHRDFYREHFPHFSDKRFSSLMEFFNLPMHRPAGLMSTGQKNQFEVILAVSQGADYIFMDEPFAGNDVFNREDFYKVLLGILEPHETVLLSTHLLEEVEPVIGRAIILRQGKIVADALSEQWQGQGLLRYVKQTYQYQADRVGKALRELTGEEADA